MGYHRKHLKEPVKLLYSFGGKRIELVGVITLPIFFGTPQNSHTEYITFDVVNMLYPYNAIFGRGLWNTFEAGLHSGYLCLKIPTTFGVISVFGSQKDARNIEQCFAPSHINIHFWREEIEQYQQTEWPVKQEALEEFKKATEAECDFKKVALNPRLPERAIHLGTKTSPEE
jgi:hypothetical protein